MALSRLFGKSRKEVASPTEHIETVEKEDTVIVNTASSQSRPAPAPAPAPAVLPYQLGGAVQGLSLGRQESFHPLQGVQFSLNSRLNTGQEMDYVKVALDSVGAK